MKDQVEGSVERSTGAVPPARNDDSLLGLETQLTGLLEELASIRSGGAGAIQEPRGPEVDAILTRLYPVEYAIMTTPAHTVVGLGVKARHTAHVMSEYWDKPLDQIDWHAKAVEAVCDMAGVPAPASSLQD